VYSHGFVVEFESEEDRKYYLEKDPAHLAFVESVKPLVNKVGWYVPFRSDVCPVGQVLAGFAQERPQKYVSQSKKYPKTVVLTRNSSCDYMPGVF